MWNDVIVLMACSAKKVKQNLYDPIRHLHISHNAPYLPPKILHKHCFSFLLGITAVPREIENNAYARFWGEIKCIMGNVQVAYGVACSRLRDSGEKSFSKEKCEKRAGAGERQGGSLPFFPPPPSPLLSRTRLIFAFLVLIRPHYTI